MCGLTAVLGHAPDLLVERAATAAAARGPHTHGWARHVGGWVVEHGDGPLTVRPRPGLSTIGHSRLATSGASSGALPDPDEGQPLQLDGRVLAHNGRVTDVELLDLYPGAVDSWSILAAVVAGDDLGDVLAAAHDGPCAAIIGQPDGSIQVARVAGRRGQRAHPLYVAEGDRWTVISSGPIPGSRLIPEGIHDLPAR